VTDGAKSTTAALLTIQKRSRGPLASIAFPLKNFAKLVGLDEIDFATERRNFCHIKK
jgi:hypothetical protein